MNLDLGEQLAIGNVHECHLQWRDAANAEDDICIDAGRLHNVDTAGLQLLLVLKRNVEARGRRFSWLEVSPELTQVAVLVGLQHALDLADA